MKDEDSAFGVSFPGLPGCYAAADNIDDVPAKAREALSLWFEDAQVVEPRSLASICDEAIAALAQGAFLIAIPHEVHIERTVR